MCPMHVLRYIQIWLYGLKWQTFRCPNTYPSNRETHGLQDDDGSARDLLAPRCDGICPFPRGNSNCCPRSSVAIGIMGSWQEGNWSPGCLVLSVGVGFVSLGVTVWDVGASPLALIFLAENHPLESILFSVFGDPLIWRIPWYTLGLVCAGPMINEYIHVYTYASYNNSHVVDWAECRLKILLFNQV